MGRRGPAPEPIPLRLLKGNPSKRPINSQAPEPEIEEPTRPGWLSTEAKREWTRIVPELRKLGLLSKIDRAALAMYCQAWARWVQAEKALEACETLTFSTAKGYVQQRPEVGIARTAARELRAICQEFGFTPSARSRVVASGKQEEQGSDLELLLGGSRCASG